MVAFAEKSRFVAIDTEFPGFVLEGKCEPEEPPEHQNYATLRDNVNACKLIQLGMAFTEELPQGGLREECWQFHFAFDLHADVHAPDALRMLTEAGLDWNR